MEVMKISRVKNIWIILFSMVLIALIMLITLPSKESKGKVSLELIFNTNFGEVNKVSIKDEKIINDIVSMLENSEFLGNGANTNDMSGMARKDNKLILTKANGNKEEITFSYDSLYEFGYIEVEGKILVPNYDFFRYVEDLEEYTKYDTNVESQVVDLFNKYNWTVDYRINILKEKLPDNLKHKAGEYPIKIYWAYNNELSKEIGSDFTDYLGKNIVVEIYRLREPLPDFMEPRRDARGIILKYNNEIIGAYIDAGRHESFACSLNRKKLENITSKDWDQWIEDYIDYDDELEIKLSKMKPEDIIKEHFKALNNHDIKMTWATITRKNLCRYLSSNMNNQYLFNKEKDVANQNIRSAELLEINEFGDMDNGGEALEYEVLADFKFIEPITSENGVFPRFVIMRKETEKSGWRIDDIGTGP